MKTITILLTLALVGCASAQIPPPLPPKPVPQPPVEVIATVADTNTVAVRFYRGSDGGVWVPALLMPLPSGTNAPLFPLTVTNADLNPTRYYALVGIAANGAESASIGATNGLYLLNTNPPAAPNSAVSKKGN